MLSLDFDRLTNSGRYISGALASFQRFTDFIPLALRELTLPSNPIRSCRTSPSLNSISPGKLVVTTEERQGSQELKASAFAPTLFEGQTDLTFADYLQFARNEAQ